MEKYTRIKHDINGNPRYVTHFLNLLTTKEKDELSHTITILDGYRIALNRAKTIGGKKFHNKQYGGGIVFQSYDLESLDILIKKCLKEVE